MLCRTMYGARRFCQLCSRNDKEKISDFKKTDHGKQMSQKKLHKCKIFTIDVLSVEIVLL